MTSRSNEVDRAAEAEAVAPIKNVPAHGISLNLPPTASHERAPTLKHMSAPAYQSPIRHHRRASSRNNRVKETLDARTYYGSSEDDGAAIHRINQYIIKQEIGRGSFGAVHLAVDQYGTEYAVKEFSKSRLRKRAQSHLLRQPAQARRPGHLAAGRGFNSPISRLSPSDKMNQQNNNALDLIKEEIAIMKKLNHSNLVSLIEVLDDPEEDSLYMVLEMCKKGVVMKVGLEEVADPYDDECCRYWFRDMILGIEYLHEQGVIHRDIKPDNCLITEDDVLKIVDFGVSEMFEKQSDMATAKSAGSPAFQPPELCVVKHGQVSGRAADIWSMGVTLYCLRYGRIPFEKPSMLDLYESIRNDEPRLENEPDAEFADMMHRLLEKGPDKRITMDELREHPWVTKGGADPLLSKDENCSDLIEPPTDIEMNHAITGNVGHLFAVMKAVKRFKRLLVRKRPEFMDGIFGHASKIVTPPHSLHPDSKLRASRSVDTYDRRRTESMLATEGVHRDIDVSDDTEGLPQPMNSVTHSDEAHEHIEDVQPGASDNDSGVKPHSEPSRQQPDHSIARTFTEDHHGKGHAHDPLSDHLFLNVGPGADCPTPDSTTHLVSESPGAVDIDVYSKAYEEEVDRILADKGKQVTMYLTRRVEDNEGLRSHDSIHDNRRDEPNKGDGLKGIASLVAKARENVSVQQMTETSTDEQETPAA
ncbi:hypothetical protein LTR66_008488 [Elasticomyces elasticus]|nr:hypothetical protein LTR66_008488 [Elasticomyces elasticus]